jgi:hypothetical protein
MRASCGRWNKTQATFANLVPDIVKENMRRIYFSNARLAAVAVVAMLLQGFLVGSATAQTQVLPNGGIPGLNMSLLPGLPTSADNLRLIMGNRACFFGLRYTGNSYSVAMANNNLTITLGTQVPSGASSCDNRPVEGEEVDLGRLPAGNYTMTLVDPTPSSGKQLFSNVGFTVSDARIKKVSPYVRLDYSGHWWDPNDSGWGLFIWQDASDNVLAAWFTYSADGKPVWWVFQPTWLGDFLTNDADLIQTSRLPGSTSPPPNPTSLTKVGTAKLRFGRLDTSETGTITYTIGNGSTITRKIQRFKP